MSVLNDEKAIHTEFMNFVVHQYNPSLEALNGGKKLRNISFEKHFL